MNNNSFFRKISDGLDKSLDWGGYDDAKQSKARATIHATYYEACHIVTGNPREHKRAKDRWGVVTGGKTGNLKTYDA